LTALAGALFLDDVLQVFASDAQNVSRIKQAQARRGLR
jgi:hypothetical protein